VQDTAAEVRTLIDRGEMVPEHMVGDALLEALFNPETNDGVGLVVDGFPRTALQVGSSQGKAAGCALVALVTS
jgi:adenylate kinase family enzyme